MPLYIFNLKLFGMDLSVHGFDLFVLCLCQAASMLFFPFFRSHIWCVIFVDFIVLISIRRIFSFFLGERTSNYPNQIVHFVVVVCYFRRQHVSMLHFNRNSFIHIFFFYWKKKITKHLTKLIDITLFIFNFASSEMILMCTHLSMSMILLIHIAMAVLIEIFWPVIIS